MGTTDESGPTGPAPTATELDEIDAIIARSRSGALTTEAALHAIRRIVGNTFASQPADTYQKSWG